LKIEKALQQQSRAGKKYECQRDCVKTRTRAIRVCRALVVAVLEDWLSSSVRLTRDMFKAGMSPNKKAVTTETINVKSSTRRSIWMLVTEGKLIAQATGPEELLP